MLAGASPLTRPGAVRAAGAAAGRRPPLVRLSTPSGRAVFPGSSAIVSLGKYNVIMRVYREDAARTAGVINEWRKTGGRSGPALSTGSGSEWAGGGSGQVEGFGGGGMAVAGRCRFGRSCWGRGGAGRTPGPTCPPAGWGVGGRAPRGGGRAPRGGRRHRQSGQAASRGESGAGQLRAPVRSATPPGRGQSAPNSGNYCVHRQRHVVIYSRAQIVKRVK